MIIINHLLYKNKTVSIKDVDTNLTKLKSVLK